MLLILLILMVFLQQKFFLCTWGSFWAQMKALPLQRVRVRESVSPCTCFLLILLTLIQGGLQEVKLQYRARVGQGYYTDQLVHGP